MMRTQRVFYYAVKICTTTDSVTVSTIDPAPEVYAYDIAIAIDIDRYAHYR